MRRRAKRKRIKPQWVTFPRCFLLTMGMWFVVLPAFIIEKSDDRETWPAWLAALLLGMLVLGIVILGVVFIGSRRDAETWMDSASRNDASIVVMVIAAPLYLILKLLFSKPGK